MTSLAAGVATFGPLHGAVVTAAMRLLAEPGDDLEPIRLGASAVRARERRRAAYSGGWSPLAHAWISAPNACWGWSSSTEITEATLTESAPSQTWLANMPGTP